MIFLLLRLSFQNVLLDDITIQKTFICLQMGNLQIVAITTSRLLDNMIPAQSSYRLVDWLKYTFF